MKRPTPEVMARMKEELYLGLAQGDMGIRQATRRMRQILGMSQKEYKFIFHSCLFSVIGCVSNDFPFNEVDDFFGNIGGVIGQAFQVSGNQQ